MWCLIVRSPPPPPPPPAYGFYLSVFLYFLPDRVTDSSMYFRFVRWRPPKCTPSRMPPRCKSGELLLLCGGLHCIFDDGKNISFIHLCRCICLLPFAGKERTMRHGVKWNHGIRRLGWRQEAMARVFSYKSRPFPPPYVSPRVGGNTLRC